MVDIEAMVLEPWSHQSAFASLMGTAKRLAGLENARSLIRQSRQIRYLRYAQLAHAKAEEKRAEVVCDDAEIEQASTPPAEGELLNQAA